MKAEAFNALLKINLGGSLGVGLGALLVAGNRGDEGLILFGLGLLSLATAVMVWHKLKTLVETENWSLISLITICGIYVPLGIMAITLLEVVSR